MLHGRGRAYASLVAREIPIEVNCLNLRRAGYPFGIATYGTFLTLPTVGYQRRNTWTSSLTSKLGAFTFPPASEIQLIAWNFPLYHMHFDTAVCRVLVCPLHFEVQTS
ncbi:hypothetical protein LIA77_06457 [Sarocladium implicatum]|nr:hypothetical protein LIA77_06457 [Sarocladium implicatum]